MSDEERILTEIQGQIIALEHLLTSALTTKLIFSDDHVKAAEEMKSAIIGGADRLPRPTGENAEEVWKVAIEKMTHTLDKVIARARKIRRTAPPEPG